MAPVLDVVLGFGAFLERTVRPEPVEGQSRKFPNCELQVLESPYFDRIKAFLKELASSEFVRLCPSTGSGRTILFTKTENLQFEWHP